MFSYDNLNEYPNIYLHDARINGIKLNNESVELVLGEYGYSLFEEGGKEYPDGMMTTGAKIRLNYDDESQSGLNSEIIIFTAHSLFKHEVLTTAKHISLEILTNKVNSGDWELEILHEFHAVGRIALAGEIWQRKKCNLSFILYLNYRGTLHYEYSGIDNAVTNKRKYSKVDRIEELMDCTSLTDTQFLMLKRYSHSWNTDVRVAVAQVLGYISITKANQDLLLRLTRDWSKMVYMEAYKSLKMAGDLYCLPMLDKRLNSRSYIVRGYASEAVAEICVRCHGNISNYLNIIEKKMHHERNRWTQQMYYCSLYMLGADEYLYNLLNGLTSKDYRIRAITISLLKEHLSDRESARCALDFISREIDVSTSEYAELLDKKIIQSLNELIADET